VDPTAPSGKQTSYVTHSNFCGGKQYCIVDPAQWTAAGCYGGPRKTSLLLDLPASVDKEHQPQPRPVALRAIQVSVNDAGAVNSKGLATADPATFSCLQHCPSGKVTADCLTTHIDAAAAAQLKRLVALVAAPSTSAIEPKALLEMFHVKDDPCNRGRTTLSASGAANAGGECAIETDTTRSNLRIRVFVPEMLEGSWESRTPDSLRLRFNGGNYPTITFDKSSDGSRHPLNRDFGGTIEWAEADDSRLMVRTNAPGCIGVQF
jgi:hypothetical protein